MGREDPFPQPFPFILLIIIFFAFTPALFSTLILFLTLSSVLAQSIHRILLAHLSFAWILLK